MNKNIEEEFEEVYSNIYKKYKDSIKTDLNKVVQEDKLENKLSRLLLIVLLVGTFISFYLATINFALGVVAFVGNMFLLYYANKKMLANLRKNNEGGKSSVELYNEEYKNLIIREITQYINPNAEYAPDKGFPEQTYLNGQYDRPDKFYSEDYIELPINQYRLKMSEVTSVHEHETEDNGTRSTIVFQGILGTIRINNPKNHEFTITLDTFADKLNIFNNLDSSKINMSLKEFEDKFNTNSPDRLDTCEVLTEEVMKKILDYTKDNKYTFDFKIHNDIIYIRYRTGNAFEHPSLKKEIFDKETMFESYRIISFMNSLAYTLVDLLDEE